MRKRDRHCPELPPPSSLADMQRMIAQALHHATCSSISSSHSATLGSIRLLPEQQATADLVQGIVGRYGGALLADEVGSGKTFVALAVARRYHTVHVIAPATLLPMWRIAIRRAEHDPPVELHSLQRFSRTPCQRLANTANALVIIDEVHQLRNANTVRYRRIAHAIAGIPTLLLSATPLHNSPQDLRAICNLFTNTFRDELIVRRDTGSSVPSVAPSHHSVRPDVRTHRLAPVPQDQHTLDLIRVLPAPLPTHHGSAAAALVRLGLLRAWCSSDDALTVALRHRRLRGLALRDALLDGRHPSATELRSWVVSDATGQLAFSELLVDQITDAHALLPTLDLHLASLTTLAQHHVDTGHSDAHRAEQLTSVLNRHPGIPVIAFSQFERTAMALYRRLANRGGIGLLTSKRGYIASGPIARDELLGLFAPHAQGRAPPPPHQTVRLLLTTDLLAEGVNLQDAGVVVHLDMPWTDALLRQRVGRCARLGSPHPVVHVYRLCPTPIVSQVLRAEELVARKARLATRHVAGTSRRPSPAEARTQLLKYTASWARSAVASNGTSPATSELRLAICRRQDTRAITQALVRLDAVHARDSAHSVVAVVTPGARSAVALGAQTLLRAARAVGEPRDLPLTLGPGLLRAYRRVRRTLEKWLDRQMASAALGVTTPFPTNTWKEAASTHSRAGAYGMSPPAKAVGLLNRAVAALPVHERRHVLPEVARMRQAIDGMDGAGFADALSEWCAQAPPFHQASPDVVRDWLTSWQEHPLRAECLRTTTGFEETAGGLPDPSVGGAVPLQPTAMILLLPISIEA